MNRSLVITILLVVVLLAVLPIWPYSAGYGLVPGGFVGLLIVVLLVLVLAGRL